MSKDDQVREQAIEVTKILNSFFDSFSLNDQNEFRASFHLRPTSGNQVTIVSTLPFAPMRGIKVSPKNLLKKLMQLRDVLSLDKDDEKLRIMTDEMKFPKRKKASIREEDAQAAFIRNLIKQPQEYGNIKFVASEFDLFNYGKATNELKRADVLAYKDGILYDIELKNDRLTSTVDQVAGYVAHIKLNISEYTECLKAFPYCKIEEINDVRGIALVPYSETSNGRLEDTSKKNNVELWYFTQQIAFKCAGL